MVSTLKNLKVARVSLVDEPACEHCRVVLVKAANVTKENAMDLDRLGDDVLTALADPARSRRPTTDGTQVGKCASCGGPVLKTPAGDVDRTCRSCGAVVSLVAKAAPIRTPAHEVIEDVVGRIVTKSNGRLNRQAAMDAFMATPDGLALYRLHSRAAAVQA